MRLVKVQVPRVRGFESHLSLFFFSTRCAAIFFPDCCFFLLPWNEQHQCTQFRSRKDESHNQIHHQINPRARRWLCGIKMTSIKKKSERWDSNPRTRGTWTLTKRI